MSDWIPRWLSGFEEPSRPPDDYIRTIRFAHIGKDHPATVAVRSPFTLASGKSYSASDFPNYAFDVTADACAVQAHTYDSESQFLPLMSQIMAFSKFSGRKDKQPVKIKLNPDDPMPPLGPKEVEVTIEFRCKNKDCTEFLAQQMEARRYAKPLGQQ
jgi:hypothetical protein